MYTENTYEQEFINIKQNKTERLQAKKLQKIYKYHPCAYMWIYLQEPSLASLLYL